MSCILVHTFQPLSLCRQSTSLHRRLVSYRRSSSPKTNIQKIESSSSSSSEASPPATLLYGPWTLFSRILAGFGLVHIVSEYGFELTKCEGPSMMPTILPTGNEIILFERFTHRLYGLEGGGDVGIQRSLQARKKQHQYEASTGKQSWYDAPSLIFRTEPPLTYLDKWIHLAQRLTTGICVGDVIVLQHPEREGTICKRVLGLPGDMVVRSPTHSWRSLGRNSIMMLSPWDDNKDQEEHEIEDDDVEIRSNTSSLFVIPDGHIWVEGDNSTNSSDSRHYGPVPAALVLGKVLLRIWPLRGDALILRKPRPLPQTGTSFTGSTLLPAGYEGEAMQ